MDTAVQNSLNYTHLDLPAEITEFIAAYNRSHISFKFRATVKFDNGIIITNET